MLALLAAGAGLARADETALLIDATLVKPVGEEGRVAPSSGAGGDILMAPDNLLVAIGGYGALGENQPGKVARDIYDLHLQVAAATGRARDSLRLYLGVGLEVLGMTTREADRTLRGTTLGMSGQAGLIGRLGDDWLVRAGAGYLGAIVPGTGDDLGGLVFHLGIGAAFH